MGQRRYERDAANKKHLAVLEVVEEDVETLALDTILLDNDTAASDDLSGVALTVDLAETGPGAEDLGVSDLDKVDLVLSAESLDELDVLGLCAGLDEDAQMGLALVQGLGALAETARKTVVDQGIFQDLLKGILNGKLALGRLSGDLDLSGRVNGNVISSVGHLL